MSNDLNVKHKNLTTFENEIYCEKVRTDIVQQIINCVPFNVYISQLNYTTKENFIVLSGYSDSEMGPANFVKILKDLECFDSIERKDIHGKVLDFYMNNEIFDEYTKDLNMIVYPINANASAEEVQKEFKITMDNLIYGLN